MKKILASIITAVTVTACAASAFAANNSTVSVKNDEQTVAQGYDYASENEAVVSVTKLFTKLKELKNNGDKVTQVLTVKNALGGNRLTDVVLRMIDTNVYEADTEAEESVINDYKIVVTDPSGEVICESSVEDVYKTEADIFAIDLPLGTLNKKFNSETEVYNVEITLVSDDAETARKSIDWNIVCDTKNVQEENSGEEGASGSAGTVVPTQTPKATAAPTATPEVVENQKGIKYVGKSKDIIPGKYTLTGNGAVKVYNSNNELKTSIILTDGKDPSQKGVPEYALTLNEGDRVEMADYINLKAFTGAKATTAPKVTAKPSTAKTTTKAATKTNPKTSDAAPIAAIAVVAVSALGVCAYLELKKKKTE